MYRKDNGQLHIFDITQSDVFTLDPENRWMKRARIVPWEMAEEKYSHMFRKNGRPAKDIRMALGALLIKEYLKCSDEEVVAQISENPYLQGFIGLKSFTNEPPFDPSLMVWFRKRLSSKFMNEINEAMCKAEAQPEIETPADDDDDEPHGGTLIVDATCAPADIKYPTDTGLVAEGVEKSDDLIDALQEPLKGKAPRPRTYRNKSRKLYTGFVQIRKPSKKLIRRTRGKLLNYLKRNLAAIDKMFNNGSTFNTKQAELYQILLMLYAQQREMHDKKTKSIENRIVSINQPHIRPIVRGKAASAVEFGAKVNTSVVNGYIFTDEISYDAYYEGSLLETAIKNYRDRFGMLPSKILADQAYTSRENRRMCKDLGISLMGKPLGRPRKGTKPGINREDIGSRNEIEGKFGTLKTYYGWNRVKARLPESGKTVITVAVFAMNLAKRAKSLLRLFLNRYYFQKFQVPVPA